MPQGKAYKLLTKDTLSLKLYVWMLALAPSDSSSVKMRPTI